MVQRPPKTHTVEKVMQFLLNEQYVCLNGKSTKLWKVTKGSGVGLKHSGFIADLAFATLGDRWMVQPRVMQHFGVEYVKRYWLGVSIFVFVYPRV